MTITGRCIKSLEFCKDNSETISRVPIEEITEVFPEPRPPEIELMPGANMVGLCFNHFFPWQINQDGTEQETFNHIGRQELHSFFTRSFNDDNNLINFNRSVSGPDHEPLNNTFYLHQVDNISGHYLTVDAIEFETHGAGQLALIRGGIGSNPTTIKTSYLSHESIRFPVPDNQSAPPEHVGFFRNPIYTQDNLIFADHTGETRQANNDGSRANPQPRYDFTIKKLMINDQDFWELEP